ncbi:MAG TPA: discoidin domain-containing protein [Candidatus Hydrogenedens sp.]|nr:discoidin domain-containing protein [Candidatus Hydrogenedens sp.]
MNYFKLSLATFMFTMFSLLLLSSTSAMSADATPPAGKVELKIELPEPFFGGTPIDYYSPNLEPEDYKDRPPYYVPEGCKLASKDKPVTSSVPPTRGQLKQITDGDKDYGKKSVVELPAGLQWVQIDLEKELTIYAIVVWHFHEGKRVYKDFIVTVGNDPEFKDGGKQVYNNDYDNSSGLGIGKDKEYIENNKGRLIGIDDGVKGRYVRLYSNGNSYNDMNHYIEVEIYGKE